ncbi:uncharacterized protein LOC128729312 [Anopheles nili]|uniref:uncharacterized protein LOC128729312 n=1 Tax=Anopheles nili TaxID=185578 RepID=UPI00237C3B65|nr:uncharacterized protein LOC128729312 [Anopheles nili]
MSASVISQRKEARKAGANVNVITPASHQPVDDANAGFGKYLRSQEGIEMMKLFVIANTIVVFMTMAWPQMQQSYQILRSLVFNDAETNGDNL